MWPKVSIFKHTELVPESTRISALGVSQAPFPELEDQLFLWVDTMRCFKQGHPSTLIMEMAVEIARYFEYQRK